MSNEIPADPYRLKPWVAAYYGTTPRTLDNWVQRGKLPAPDRLPNGRPAWRESVIVGAVRRGDNAA